MLTKAERFKRSQLKHQGFRRELDGRIKAAKSAVEYNERLRAAYFLCSMLTLWIKIPAEKATMPALGMYVERIISDRQKDKS